MEGTWLNTVSSKQGHDFLLLKHDISCFWVSESWLTLNLSIKFPSDVNFVNAHFSHTKICLHYVMFSSDLLYSAWHFPPPFLFFPSLCWKEKLFLTVPEAFSLSFTRVHGTANPLCRADPPVLPWELTGGAGAHRRHPWVPRDHPENGEGIKNTRNKWGN